MRLQLETEEHTNRKMPLRLGQARWKGAAGTTAGAHTGPGVIYVPTARAQAPLTLRAHRRILRRIRPTWWANRPWTRGQ